MLKSISFIFATLFLILFEVSAQKPTTVERTSKLELDLKRSSKRTFSIVLSTNDMLSVSARAEGTVNVKIIDPNGQVMYQGIVKGDLVEWQKSVTVDGVYIVEIESSALLLNTRVALNLSILRSDFIYGHPSMDSLISQRTRKVMVDGEFEISRKTPKTYNYGVLKGDTLIVSLKPLSKNTPNIEIVNDLNELLFAAFSSAKEEYVEIPILESGSYSITMSSDAFLSKQNYIKVEKISPSKYVEEPEPAPAEEPKDSEEPKTLYDSIPEIYLDTIYFVGAQRDIINPSELNIKIEFEDPNSIIKWFILYGAGNEFLNEADNYLPLLEGEPLAAGATNILTAYGLGFLRKLPTNSNQQVEFTPSSAIRNKLKPPIKSNYAIISGGYGSHNLQVENKSRSAGHKVLVQVVALRRVSLDE
jgi:hypothetical protein